MSMPEHPTANTHIPRYDLSVEEVNELQGALITDLNQRVNEHPDLYSVWLQPHLPYADLVRKFETKYWGDMSDIMAAHEDESLFLALVDLREGNNNQIVHGFRVSAALPAVERAEGEAPESTGLVLIDDIAQSGQDFSVAEFLDYYRQRGFNPAKFITVETNFRVAKAPRYNDLPMAQIGYISVFEMLSRSGVSENETAIFAALNKLAVLSLKGAGIEYEPIAGRPELRIPVADGEFDDNYTAVAIPASKANLKVFSTLR